MATNPKSNQGHVAGRQVQPPPRHPCSPKDNAKKDKFRIWSKSKRAGEIHARAVQALEDTRVLRRCLASAHVSYSLVCLSPKLGTTRNL